jgi:small nuclear ribonucleoprotein (snRNP)-like protein
MKANATRNDGRALVGQMLAYDKHMNFVLAECEEFRTVKVGFASLSFVLDMMETRDLRSCLRFVHIDGNTADTFAGEEVKNIT